MSVQISLPTATLPQSSPSILAVDVVVMLADGVPAIANIPFAEAVVVRAVDAAPHITYTKLLFDVAVTAALTEALAVLIRV